MDSETLAKMFWIFVVPIVGLFAMAILFGFHINQGVNGLLFGIANMTWMYFAANECYPNWKSE